MTLTKFLCALSAMFVTQLIVSAVVEFLHISAWDRGYYTGYITATVLFLMIYGWE
jgi:hypothetical protein